MRVNGVLFDRPSTRKKARPADDEEDTARGGGITWRWQVGLSAR
jgi:hypothetical protein